MGNSKGMRASAVNAASVLAVCAVIAVLATSSYFNTEVSHHQHLLGIDSPSKIVTASKNISVSKAIESTATPEYSKIANTSMVLNPVESKDKDAKKEDPKDVDIYARLGQFGDYYGGVLNPVVGIITILLLVITIWMQAGELADAKRKEERDRTFNDEQLRLANLQFASSEKANKQQLEIAAEQLKTAEEARKEQLGEAQRQAKIAEEARLEQLHEARELSQTIARQSFDQTFFSWLTTYRKIVENFKGERKDIYSQHRYEYSSYEGMNKLFNQLLTSENSSISYIVLNLSSNDSTISLGAVNQVRGEWERVFRVGVGTFDTMFRSVYRLLLWVDQQDKTLNQEQKMAYASIVRAHISDIEYAYFFFNGYTERGLKLVALINKYALFDNFDIASSTFGLIPLLKKLPTCPYTETAFSSDKAREALNIL